MRLPVNMLDGRDQVVLIASLFMVLRTQKSTFTFHKLPSNLQYTHISRTLVGNKNCWSLKCNWSITWRRCSSYIFILELTLGFNRFRKDNYKTKRETFKFWDSVSFILEVYNFLFRIGTGRFHPFPRLTSLILKEIWLLHYQWSNTHTHVYVYVNTYNRADIYHSQSKGRHTKTVRILLASLYFP